MGRDSNEKKYICIVTLPLKLSARDVSCVKFRK